MSWLYVCGLRKVLSACDSCRRMSSASTPPSRKNAKVRTMYMIPIRLWSVVVTQLVQPVRSRVTEWATTCGSGVAVRGEVAVAMRGSRGLLLRVTAGVDRLALASGGLVGRLDLGLPRGQVLLELRRRHRADVRDHVGVVAPAELRAVPAELGAGQIARDLEPGVVRVARDGIELAAQLRDPPRVRDVLRADVERDRRVDRDDQLGVGEDGVQRRVEAVLRVGIAPDVLLSVDAVVQRIAVGRQALAGTGRGQDSARHMLKAARPGVRRVAD